MLRFSYYRGWTKPYRYKDNDCDRKDAFNKRKDLLTKWLSMTLKKRMVIVLVRRIVLHGSETWTLQLDEINRLEALEARLWRGLVKSS
jgi:hypothetical protein